MVRESSLIEPEIGHLRTDGRPARCALKGTFGDAFCALLCGCGHILRKRLAYLGAFWAVLAALLASLIRFQARASSGPAPSQGPAC